MGPPWLVVLHVLSRHAALAYPGLVWSQHASDERQECVALIVSSSVFLGDPFDVRYYQPLM
jgi:hypothetical protein